jgi:hypothetical protein
MFERYSACLGTGIVPVGVNLHFFEGFVSILGVNTGVRRLVRERQTLDNGWLSVNKIARTVHEIDFFSHP